MLFFCRLAENANHSWLEQLRPDPASVQRLCMRSQHLLRANHYLLSFKRKNTLQTRNLARSDRDTMSPCYRLRCPTREYGMRCIPARGRCSVYCAYQPKTMFRLPQEVGGIQPRHGGGAWTGRGWCAFPRLCSAGGGLRLEISITLHLTSQAECTKPKFLSFFSGDTKLLPVRLYIVWVCSTYCSEPHQPCISCEGLPVLGHPVCPLHLRAGDVRD